MVEIAVRKTQAGVSCGEVRVQFEGMLVERYSRRITLGARGDHAHAEGFQGFERGGRGFHRYLKRLHRS